MSVRSRGYRSRKRVCRAVREAREHSQVDREQKGGVTVALICGVCRVRRERVRTTRESGGRGQVVLVVDTRLHTRDRKLYRGVQYFAQVCWELYAFQQTSQSSASPFPASSLPSQNLLARSGSRLSGPCLCDSMLRQLRLGRFYDCSFPQPRASDAHTRLVRFPLRRPPSPAFSCAPEPLRTP